MTDEQIVKALGQCSIYEFDGKQGSCKDCPFNGCDYCKYELCDFALDLIKRQQAEIEKLNIDLDAMRCAANSLKMHYDKAKSEAVWDIATEYEAYKEAVEVALVETRSEAAREFAEKILNLFPSDMNHTTINGKAVKNGTEDKYRGLFNTRRNKNHCNGCGERINNKCISW